MEFLAGPKLRLRHVPTLPAWKPEWLKQTHSKRVLKKTRRMEALEPETEPPTTCPRALLAWRRMVARTTARATIDERLRGRTTEFVEQCRVNKALPQNIASLTVIRLREELRSAGLPTSGLKAALVERFAASPARGLETCSSSPQAWV